MDEMKHHMKHHMMKALLGPVLSIAAAVSTATSPSAYANTELPPMMAVPASINAANAAGTEVPILFSIRAERSRHSGREQIALRFLKNNTVELITNSGFLRGPRASSRLGRFTAPLKDKLATRRRELDRARLTMAYDIIPTEFYTDPVSKHATRYYLGTRELTIGDPYRPMVEKILRQAWTLADWQPVQAVEIRAIGPDRVEIRPEGDRVAKAGGKATRQIASLGCTYLGTRKKAPDQACPIRDYGTAYLRFQAAKDSSPAREARSKR
jgi:hypothetical protein